MFELYYNCPGRPVTLKRKSLDKVPVNYPDFQHHLAIKQKSPWTGMPTGWESFPLITHLESGVTWNVETLKIEVEKENMIFWWAYGNKKDFQKIIAAVQKGIDLEEIELDGICYEQYKKYSLEEYGVAI